MTPTIGLIGAGLLVSMPLIYTTPISSAVVLQWLVAMAWLLAVDRYRVSGHVAWVAASGAALGLGLYGRTSAMVMMPLYLLLSLIALAATATDRRPPIGAFAAPVAAFVVVAAPFGVFLIRHPEYFRDAVLAHGLYDARRYNVLQGAREVFSWVGLSARLEVYWDYFNPAFLFLSGGSVTASLWHPRIFLLPFAVLLPIGIWQAVAPRSSITWWLIAGGMLIAPVVGALVAQPPAPAYLLPAAPFAALLGANGLAYLWDVFRLPLSDRAAAR